MGEGEAMIRKSSCQTVLSVLIMPSARVITHPGVGQEVPGPGLVINVTDIYYSTI